MPWDVAAFVASRNDLPKVDDTILAFQMLPPILDVVVTSMAVQMKQDMYTPQTGVLSAK